MKSKTPRWITGKMSRRRSFYVCKDSLQNIHFSNHIVKVPKKTEKETLHYPSSVPTALLGGLSVSTLNDSCPIWVKSQRSVWPRTRPDKSERSLSSCQVSSWWFNPLIRDLSTLLPFQVGPLPWLVHPLWTREIDVLHNVRRKGTVIRYFRYRNY